MRDVIAPSVPALSAWAGRAITAHVHPSQARPSGAWAVQVPLAADLDLSSAGKVLPDICVVANTMRPNDQGLFRYNVFVTEVGSVQTSISQRLSGDITALPVLHEHCRSIDFSQAIRPMRRQRNAQEQPTSR